MKKTAIFFLIIFAMSILATSASAQLVPPCDPALNACVTQLTGCNPQFNVCEQTDPGQGPNDPIFERGGGRLQQAPQNPNETFDRVTEIMRRHNQTRINIIRGF